MHISTNQIIQARNRSPRLLVTIIAMLWVMLPLLAQAQQQISGTVTDSENNPLPGVSVLLKGTTTGTVTDAGGNYSLSVSDTSIPLVFSFVGFQSQEVAIAGRSSITIVLADDLTTLGEVVVVGYGSQDKAQVTGAVATVSGQDLNKRVVTNPAALLQGQLPGLQVVQNSGEPGNEGVNFKIRGIGTFSGAGTDPLIIIDGLPGNISALNPNDIANVTILKDAAAAAIYGARGANGVIVVTTKKGQSGKTSITYTFNNGTTKATALPDLITNSAEFMALNNEARVNSGLNPIYSQDQIDLYRNATDRNKYPNHNWLGDMFRTVNVQNHYLNVNGGNENTSFSIGLGHTNQPGVMRGFDYRKSTLQLNLKTKINKHITFGTNSMIRYGKRKGAPQGSTDQFLATLAQSPLYAPKLWDGSGRYTFRAYSNEAGNKNPVAIAENLSQNTDEVYAQLNGFINVELIKGLNWETRGGANYRNAKSSDFRGRIPMYLYSDLSAQNFVDVGTLGLKVGQAQNLYTVLYSQLTYEKQMGKHFAKILAGGQQEQNRADTLGASRREFPTNQLTQLNAGPADGQTNYGTAAEWAIRSYYGRINYDYDDKYLLEASTRYDGTSRLPSDNRWGLFYAFSGGWRISRESFLTNVSWLNDLKLRGSWGKLGNQNIGTYPYQNVLSQSVYPFNGLSTGFYAPGLVDPNLTWETTKTVDFGFDARVLNDRLEFSFDWFKKDTYDILRSYQVPLYTGLNAPTVNNGKIRNIGYEAQVAYRGTIAEDINFRLGANIQHYKNKLVSYGSRDISDNSIREEGHELDEWYLYQWDGIFQSQQEIDNSPKQPVVPQPGDLKIKDVNGDGKIDASDRTYTKGRYPVASYNLSANFAWKGFDLGIQFYGSWGQKLYVSGWGIEPFRQGSAPTTAWRNRWTPDNPSTTMPRIYVADSYPAVQNYNSTYYLQDASFLRLKNLTLGYTVPSALVSKIKMQSLRFFFSGDNLHTWSKYKGLDPERTSVSGNYVAYPQNRVFTLGLSASL
ncbi:SusC/RagA family TonB-linked outer membrane protein [Chryseolinea soli]|uniref:TonB-dependent receptor n=1 Tax=Chryseolinea soli TaxID=2321403 RepID=A0A385SQZ7_9BACT|nr:TonB-dependent receptor [Chryseolinea soli]AYB31960.1 TonB-dependent receptor [Chryseolinea soli]